MDRDEHLAHLRSDGHRMADVVGGDLRVRVPTCPDWDLGELVEHTGFVHRWQTAVVRDAPDGFPEAATWRFGPADGEAPADWLRNGVDEAVRLLSSVDPDLPRWTWAEGAGAAGWYARRLAHETVVHRIDAELAVRLAPAPVDPALAVDGVDEMCDVFLPAAVGQPIGGDGQRLHLHATDAEGEWLLTLQADHVDVARRHADADATIEGRALDLLLLMWGREPLEEVATAGATDVVDLFRAAAKI